MQVSRRTHSAASAGGGGLDGRASTVSTYDAASKVIVAQSGRRSRARISIEGLPPAPRQIPNLAWLAANTIVVLDLLFFGHSPRLPTSKTETFSMHTI